MRSDCSKLWYGNTLRVEDATVSVDRVGDMDPQQIAKTYETVNRYGFAIVEHAPRVGEEVEELVDLGKMFGRPVVHDRADERGIVIISEMAGYGEFVGTSSGPHLMHTGGTFMPWDVVPKIVLLQCEKQSRVGGRSLMSSGAAAYLHFQEHDPEGLKLLSDPNVFAVKRSARGVGQFGNRGGERKAIFDTKRLGDGNVWLTFRFDGQVKLDLHPDEAHEPFDRLVDFFNRSENQVDFKLQPNQILVCDNTSVVHSRTAYQAGSERKLNRLQLDGTGIKELSWGFPVPTAQDVKRRTPPSRPEAVHASL